VVLINYATKEIVAKIVYYGPALCGKTTNLQHVYTRLNPKKRGKMISLATEADRTLFFDFLPMELGTVQGFKVRFQLYTVPGQVFYSSTRKLVLKGADAVVFVADSQAEILDKNIESIEDMKVNLIDNNLDPDSIPIVFQYNKRDLNGIMEIDDLEKHINYRGTPYTEAVAVDGSGVMETFREVTKLLIYDLKKKHALLDASNIKELPDEVFAPAKLPEDEKPIEYELELGSGIHDGSEEDVVAGELLDQIESVSVSDPAEAEAFMDKVREGTTMEEAKEQAALAAKISDSPKPANPPGSVDLSSLPVGERELTPDELDAGPVEEETYTIPESKVGELMRPAQAQPAPPAAPSVAAPVPQIDIAPLLSPIKSAIEQLLEEVSDLRAELRAQKDNETAPVPPQQAEGSFAKVEELINEFRASMEGQDRLLLSILEAVRESKKNNLDSHEKLEDAMTYLIDKVRDEDKTAKKKWF